MISLCLPPRLPGWMLPVAWICTCNVTNSLCTHASLLDIAQSSRCTVDAFVSRMLSIFSPRRCFLFAITCKILGHVHHSYFPNTCDPFQRIQRRYSAFQLSMWMCAVLCRRCHLAAARACEIHGIRPKSCIFPFSKIKHRRGEILLSVACRYIRSYVIEMPNAQCPRKYAHFRRCIS